MHDGFKSVMKAVLAEVYPLFKHDDDDPKFDVTRQKAIIDKVTELLCYDVVEETRLTNELAEARLGRDDWRTELRNLEREVRAGERIAIADDRLLYTSAAFTARETDTNTGNAKLG